VIRFVYHGERYVKEDHTVEKISPKYIESNRNRVSSKRFISVPLRDGYKAVVEAGAEKFKFELSGNGDTLFIRFDSKHLVSDHIYGVSSECKRLGEKLSQCVEVINGTENAKGILRYNYDGEHFNVVLAFPEYRPLLKDHFYNDNRYIYWESYKNGKLISVEKYIIDKVHKL